MMYDIDPRSPLPVYEQIKRQVRILIASGCLEDGSRLPSIRELAQDLKVNPNTVAKAYAQLETEGFLKSRAGAGFFAAVDHALLDAERRSLVEAMIDDFLAEAARLGLHDDDLLDCLRRKLEGGRVDQHR